ncbi:hypothetical protein GCM10017710_09410 [Arthrobacter ramosus]
MFVPASLGDGVPVESQSGDYKVRIYPPYRSMLPWDPETAEIAVLDAARLLDRDLTVVADPESLLNGEPCIECDAMQIDFVADDFDRRPGPREDPPTELASELLNNWISRLRLIAGTGWIPRIAAGPFTARMDYLHDDGSELDPDPDLYRRRQFGSGSFNAVALTPGLWAAVGNLPLSYEVSASEELFLDAQALAAQQVGPALVLAFTALETRMTMALDILARMHTVHPSVWEWVSNRRISTAELFISLPLAVAQRSLKEEARLWEGFQKLRKARNTFAHEGKAPVDAVEGARLVGLTREILDWIDGLLPPTAQRPRYDGSADQFQRVMLFATPMAVSDAGDPPADGGAQP